MSRRNSVSMRITSNPPCKNCSEDNIRKHCFSCGKCGIKFITKVIYNRVEYGICSEKCNIEFWAKAKLR